MSAQLEVPVAVGISRARTGRTTTSAVMAWSVIATAWIVIALFVLAAAFPALVAPYSPVAPDPAAALQAPSLAHPFGTDYLGRDLLSRVVHGARETLIGAGAAVAVGVVGGLFLGICANLLGRPGDVVVSRLIDVLLSVPTLLIAIVIVTVLGFGTLYAGLAVGVASIGQFARLTRAQLLTTRGMPFVESARISGRSLLGNTLIHALPSVRGPILALVPVQFGTAILSLAALGFLGFGAQPPTPEWGSMIADGSAYIISGRWWTVAFPSSVIVVVVLSLNTVSRRLSRLGGGSL